MPGTYYPEVLVASMNEYHDRLENVAKIDVEPSDYYGTGRGIEARFGLVFFPVPSYLGTGRLSRSTTWSETGFQIHTAGGFEGPSLIAIRSPATEAFAQALDLGLCLRLIDIGQPPRRMGHRTSVEDGLVLLRGCGAGPEPILGALHQTGPNRIAFNVAVDGQEMVVFLNRKGPVASLPDVAAGVIMLMITADVRGHQPHHVRTQVAIAPRPEREMEMVRHQTVSQQTDIDLFARFAEELAEGCEVAVLAEDGAATITAIEDVITVAAQSVACTAWHGGKGPHTISLGRANAKFFPASQTWGKSSLGQMVRAARPPDSPALIALDSPSPPALCPLEDMIMSIHLEAIYENGIFRPLQPVCLPERKRVTVTFDEEPDAADSADELHFVLPPDRWQAFCDALDAPPKDIPALRKLLTEASLFDSNGNAAP
jgi:predicted DNA-binding antitoxin AbrB/MazE fold protein